MHQLIYALLNENSISAPQDLMIAIIPLMKLLTLTIIGLGLSYFETLPKSTCNLLSKLVFALFLPCLIFVTLGQSITLENFINWWFIPVNVLISTFIGCLLGYFVVIICHPPPELRRFVIIITGFGNTGNLAISIVHSVCYSSDNIFGSDCQTNGLAYVSFSQWIAVILAYTFIYHGLEPEPEPEPEPPLEYNEIANTPMKHMLQPPTIASVLAIIVGIVPHLKGFVFGYDAPLSFVSDSLKILGEAMVPAVMLVVGSMFAEASSESTLGLKAMIAIIVARLVVLPLFGIGIVVLADKLNLVVSGDRMYLFVVLLQYTTPSAILLGAITHLKGYAVREASALLLWQHVFGLVSLSVYAVMYLKLLRWYV